MEATFPSLTPGDGPEWSVQAGPPPVIEVSAPASIEEGGEIEVTVTLPVPPAPPDGVGVRVVLGRGGVGAGGCPGALLGECLDILGPYEVHGPFSSVAGEVQASITTTTTAGDTIGVQAVVLQPTRAFLSETTSVSVGAACAGPVDAAGACCSAGVIDSAGLCCPAGGLDGDGLCAPHPCLPHEVADSSGACCPPSELGDLCGDCDEHVDFWGACCPFSEVGWDGNCWSGTQGICSTGAARDFFGRCCALNEYEPDDLGACACPDDQVLDYTGACCEAGEWGPLTCPAAPPPAGPCSPPDSWTGPIPPDQYTNLPWEPAYDAGLAILAEELRMDGSGNFSSGFLVYDATVTAVGSWGDGAPRAWVGDGTTQLLVSQGAGFPTVGERVGFAATRDGYIEGEVSIDQVTAWTVLSTGNIVSVRDLGAENVMLTDQRNQLLHVYGELTTATSLDCSYWPSLSCFVLSHDGTTDLVRLDDDNSWGIEDDYDGGLCAENIAPIMFTDGDDGFLSMIDVVDASWMRVWPASP